MWATGYGQQIAAPLTPLRHCTNLSPIRVCVRMCACRWCSDRATQNVTRRSSSSEIPIDHAANRSILVGWCCRRPRYRFDAIKIYLLWWVSNVQALTSLLAAGSFDCWLLSRVVSLCRACTLCAILACGVCECPFWHGS